MEQSDDNFWTKDNRKFWIHYFIVIYASLVEVPPISVADACN